MDRLQPIEYNPLAAAAVGLMTLKPALAEAIDIAWRPQKKREDKPKPTVVLADHDMKIQFGAPAVASEIASRIDQIFGRIDVVDKSPKDVRELVDSLLAQEKSTGHKLGDVVISAHGWVNGQVWIDGRQYYVDDYEFTGQFERLHGHFAAGAIIKFASCKTGAGELAPNALKKLSWYTGVPVRAYVEIQRAANVEGGDGAYVEGHPDFTYRTGIER